MEQAPEASGDGARMEEAFAAASRYCAYQERCEAEVRRRIARYALCAEGEESVLRRLREERLLDEDRFARAFAGGKFRLKGWGRVKIRRELAGRGLGEACIESALAEIDGEAYAGALRGMLARKARTLHGGSPFERRARLTRYALGRGFEGEAIREALGAFDSGG